MIWVLVAIYSIQMIQASWVPSVKEIKSRTRWCLGEGAHCPIFLPFNVQSCCKPYVCTAIPKTCKPTIVFQFSSYKDHRCLLPSTKANVTQTTSQKKNVHVNPKLHEESSTESLNINVVKNEPVEEYSTSNKSNTETSDENQSLLSTEDQAKKNENDKQFEDRKIVKRSIGSSSESPQRINLKTNSRNEDVGSESSEVSSTYENSSNDSSSRSSEPLGNSTDYYYDYYDTNNTVPSKFSDQTNATELKESFNSTRPSVNSSPSLEKSLVSKNISETTSKTVNSAEDSEEDWHSSQMVYDTRPMLRKVVTVEPFHIFQSPEVIRLNESSEMNSLDG